MKLINGSGPDKSPTNTNLERTLIYRMETLVPFLKKAFPKRRLIVTGDQVKTVDDIGRHMTTSSQHANWLFLIQKTCQNEKLFEHNVPLYVVVDHPPDILAICNGHNFYFSTEKLPTELAWKTFFRNGLSCGKCSREMGRTAMCMKCGTCICHNCITRLPAPVCSTCQAPIKTTEIHKAKRKGVTVVLDASTSCTQIRNELKDAMRGLSLLLSEIYIYRSCAGTARQLFYNLDLTHAEDLRRNPQATNPFWQENKYPIQPLARPLDARKDLEGIFEHRLPKHNFVEGMKAAVFAQGKELWEAIISYVAASPKNRFGVTFAYKEVIYLMWVKECSERNLLTGAYLCCTVCGKCGAGVRLKWCRTCRSAAVCSAECAREDHACSAMAAVWGKNHGAASRCPEAQI
jgi:hypothetical protein